MATFLQIIGLIFIALLTYFLNSKFQSRRASMNLKIKNLEKMHMLVLKYNNNCIELMLHSIKEFNNFIALDTNYPMNTIRSIGIEFAGKNNELVLELNSIIDLYVPEIKKETSEYLENMNTFRKFMNFDKFQHHLERKEREIPKELIDENTQALKGIAACTQLFLQQIKKILKEFQNKDSETIFEYYFNNSTTRDKFFWMFIVSLIFYGLILNISK